MIFASWYSTMNKTQKRTILVLERMIEQCKEDNINADVFAEMLEPMLRELHGEDFFGTEGQCDPRGDFRNGRWSMKKVEGIDK